MGNHSDEPRKRNKTKKGLELLAALAITTGVVFLAIFTSPNHIGLAIAFVFTIVMVFIAIVRHSNLTRLASNSWNHPIWLVIPLIAVFTGSTCWLYVEHDQQIAGKITTPEEGIPWREGLVARVFWDKPPSQGMRNGFADTVRMLGFSYEGVDFVEEANIRIWTDSWKFHCKWPTTEGFVSLDPNPSDGGSQTGDIHLCKITTPIKFHPTSDYSTVAHETAHIFAAQVHFGNGLMGEGGGDGSPCFNETEIETMRKNINDFHESVRKANDNSNGQPFKSALEDGLAKPPCGSEELRPGLGTPGFRRAKSVEYPRTAGTLQRLTAVP